MKKYEQNNKLSSQYFREYTELFSTREFDQWTQDTYKD